MTLRESLDSISTNIINVITSSNRLIEAYDKHSIKDALPRAKSLAAKLDQSIKALNGVKNQPESSQRRELIKVTDDILSQMNELKRAAIDVINSLGVDNLRMELSDPLKTIKQAVASLSTALNGINSPNNVKDKLLHTQSTHVKQGLDGIANRDLFRAVFNEAYGHHSSHGHHDYHSHHHTDHTSENLPKFNKYGDWFHDGICTHFDGISMEDLYIQPNGKKLSCGFLLEDEATGKFLGCHPTGQPAGVYDIPKGCMKVDGEPLDTAIRELKEETGMELTGKEEIEDLGVFEHKPEKDIHLFRVKVPVDIKTLHCDSMFKDFRSGDIKPECDDFALIDDVSHFLHSIQPMLNKVL